MIRPMLEYTFNMNTFGQQIYRGGTQSRFGDAYAGGDSLPQLYKDIAIGMAEFSNGLIDASPNTLYFWSNAYADGAMRFIREIGRGKKESSNISDILPKLLRGELSLPIPIKAN